MKALIKKRKVKLGELQPGKLFMYNETLALKSEYMTDNGAIEAFIIGSGEMFWGGAKTPNEQAELEVREISIWDFK